MVVSILYLGKKVYLPNKVMRSHFFSNLNFFTNMKDMDLKIFEEKFEFRNFHQDISPRTNVIHFDFDLYEILSDEEKINFDDMVNIVKYLYVYFDEECSMDLKNELKKVYIKNESQSYIFRLLTGTEK